MPRQNFLTKDFFVAVCEKEARQGLLQLTQCSQHIKFIKENTLTQSFRFLYQPVDRKRHFQIDISLLPLDGNYTQIVIHLSYTNGQELTRDAGAKTVLLLFEQAVQASLRGDTAAEVLSPLRESAAKRKGLSHLFNLQLANWFVSRKKGMANI
jgi:hypothetical protein